MFNDNRFEINSVHVAQFKRSHCRSLAAIRLPRGNSQLQAHQDVKRNL